MIDKDWIKSEVTPCEEVPGAQRLRVSIRLSTSRIVAGSDPVEVEERRAKAEIWHAIYGDLLCDLGELKRHCLSAAVLGGHGLIVDAFKKLESKLAITP